MKFYAGRVLGVLVMLGCSAGFTLAQAQTPLLSAAIVEKTAQAETQRARAARCDARAGAHDITLQKLNENPVANASRITAVTAARAAAQGCSAASNTAAAVLDDALLQMQVDFVVATGVTEEDLTAQMATLRSHQASLAVTRFDASRLQRQVDKLNMNPVENAELLLQKNQLLAALLAELQSATAEVVAIADSMQGTETAALEEAQRTGSAQLAWSVPVTREDGQPLAASELAGYEIYMLTESTGESAVFVVSDPMAISYIVADLAPDTYHFSICAFDKDSHFSELSPVVSKTIS